MCVWCGWSESGGCGRRVAALPAVGPLASSRLRPKNRSRSPQPQPARVFVLRPSKQECAVQSKGLVVPFVDGTATLTIRAQLDAVPSRRPGRHASERGATVLPSASAALAASASSRERRHAPSSRPRARRFTVLDAVCDNQSACGLSLGSGRSVRVGLTLPRFLNGLLNFRMKRAQVFGRLAPRGKAGHITGYSKLPELSSEMVWAPAAHLLLLLGRHLSRASSAMSSRHWKRRCLYSSRSRPSGSVYT